MFYSVSHTSLPKKPKSHCISLATGIILALSSPAAFASDQVLKPGDIIMQESNSGQALMIKRASRSNWTHVGVVLSSNSGKLQVLEAVTPVRFTPLKTFISRTQKYQILRLKNPIGLSPEIRKKAVDYINKQIGKPYDRQFLWGDNKMYCSELVWKCYKNIFGVELCKPQPFEFYNLEDPLVKKAIKERLDGKVPKNHKVVAPGDIANSKLLVEIKISK